MIGIVLDVLLGSLLLAAIVVGLRLEKRLRALREGQADFAKAVSELNNAAAKTEASLAEVRSATLQAQTTLADHTQDARAAAAKLELQASAALAAAQRLDAATQRASIVKEPPLVSQRAALSQAFSSPPPRAGEGARSDGGGERPALSLDRAPSPTEPVLGSASGRARGWSPSPARGGGVVPEYEEPLALLTRVSPRSRARVDDDLFETGGRP